MKSNKLSILLFAPVLLCSFAFGAETHQHSTAAHDQGHAGTHSINTQSPLTAPGNDAFGAIQEAIRQLDADPKTDWNKINPEALRQHLVDMHNFTVNVDVLSHKSVENGFETVIRPTTKRSEESLDRVFAVHPMQLKKETGWDMQVSKKGDLFTLKVTTSKPAEISRLRALGYVGVMAMGEHHQIHHWGIVKGEDPHH